MENINLVEEYKKIVNKQEVITWDEFFDRFSIPKKARTDFAVGAILHQAYLNL
jgi:hypothetical protein